MTRAPKPVDSIQVALRTQVDDHRGQSVARQARDFLGLPVQQVRTRTVYRLFAMDLAESELLRLGRALCDPVLEEWAPGRLPLPAWVDWVVAVGFRPGVTDNLGHTARLFAADLLGRPLPEEARVFTETLYLFEGRALARADLELICRELLANGLIEDARVWSAGELSNHPPELSLPIADRDIPLRVEAIALPERPLELLELSRQRMLSLSLAELQAIRSHYSAPGRAAARLALGLPAEPTDVELECLAQTWSEHCKHKIFNARIDYQDEDGHREVINSLFRTFIVEPTARIGEKVDWLVSVFDDNAGVVRLDADTLLVYKVETHNSPSALDPYGGAITGIVGVNRDPLGTGLGAALLTNVWGYCLASPFHGGAIPEGLLHPRRVRDGVHRGVIDGGNQSGIPYSRGFELFDERFLGKPLVFCGTVGWLPSRVSGRPGELKEVRPDDAVVMVGGRIGKDGIHGATFSSEALHAASPAQAVQIGDPITQKQMADMLLEARDLGLYRALTDNGAGGLSSSVGELARLCGGAELDLDLAPLKYQGLQPWEILLSEAQERMTVAVPPEQLPAFLELAQRREVEATPIGRFTAEPRFRLRHGGRLVGELDMKFLHGGCPRMELRARWRPPRHREPADAGIDLEALEPGPLLLDLLARLNCCSRELTCRRYDHEVKGLSVVKPLVGVHGDVPADATVMRVAHGRDQAILLAEGIAPRYADLDAGAMAACVVDLAARRIIAGGGRLGQIAGLDNFCWPDPVQSELTPDGEQKLAALVRACRALAEMCEALGLPCISGKDSMKNDSLRGGVKISIPPTLLFSALGWMEDARRALDLVPADGERLYLVGETRDELGGSELFAHLAERCGDAELRGNQVPRISPERSRAVCRAVQAASAAGVLGAAHALHIGGLGLGLARLCLAGDLGAEVDLDAAPGAAGLGSVALLFSESGSRFLLTCAAGRADELEARLCAEGVAWGRLGELTASPSPRLTVRRAGQAVLSVELAELRRRYRQTLDGAMSAAAVGRGAPGSTRMEDAGGWSPEPSDSRPGHGRPPPARRQPLALVPTGFGINCEAETAHALRLAGARVELPHLNDLAAAPERLRSCRILVLAGGFSFGDHLGAGRALANRLAHRLGEPLARFVEDGGLLLGICNGFQTLARLGLVPAGRLGEPVVSLASNQHGAFHDGWVHLTVDRQSPCVFTAGLERLELPVRHGEGRFLCVPVVLERIRAGHLAPLRYCEPQSGEPALGFPANPNGSLDAVAGLCDATGRIFGLMPHPEAFLDPQNHPAWRRRPAGQPAHGLAIFQNAVRAAR